MLKIGEFARICRVSAQTLRYYDAEGVLCADHIDPFTGYRYYAPEKLEAFRRIQAYKEAGFSLDEIKRLLICGEEERGGLMAQKRLEITAELQALQTKLSMLEAMSHRKELLGERSLTELPEAEFEDDPAVWGEWVLCGRALAPTDGDPPPPTAPLEPWDGHTRLVFLPNGAAWWMFLWSRGVLYRIHAAYRTLIPNPYRVFETPEGRYMTVRYITTACLERGEEPVWLIYRQTRHAALTDLESRAFVDSTDLPLVPDPAVVGDWETVGITAHPKDFTPASIPRSRTGLWIIGVTFTARGGCIRRYAQNGGTAQQMYPYTRLEEAGTPVRGVVISSTRHTTEKYLLRDIEGETYLFIQHKSGDYCYGGLPPVWYVFRRALRPHNHTIQGEPS